MQGTQNVTLGYLRLSGEFKYNLWEFGELRPRRSSSGFLYDVKHPNGHRGEVAFGGKGLDMSLLEEMLDLGTVTKNNSLVG